ncbi:MAG TPA: DUF1810 domain-containing protein [Gemmatimonadaceae bacterium]|nr:DUF1810 domain-containing protein [Gemmatimonadaceae bacterium]
MTPGEPAETPRDSFDLDRFVSAQQQNYARALAEIRAGRKQSHWMWYVFPQLRGLGSSPMSQRYGIANLAEARAYLEHPTLGPRLREICDALVAIDGASAHDILGSPDDLKLRSCVTLFAFASKPGDIFDRVLVKFFDGVPDAATLTMLKSSAARGREV